ncbi:hypothetical protein RB195_006872 [Necator americanus]|uniref:MIF4G domain-containing protein n=1 Tax=Necator americanus TaxID=51031 RepID=A0ABR1BYF8_NECAM
MGLKKWMSVVRSEHNGAVVSSRKQDRKRAKRLKKLQNVAIAKHQPIEKVMLEALSSKKKSKKKKRARLNDSSDELGNKRLLTSPEDESLSKHGKNKHQIENDSESDSDENLTYEQYLKEVKDKRLKLVMERDDAAQDDIDIHRYSKLLGIKGGNKSRKLKSFTNDGLDYLLDFCESDDRKGILASTTDQEMALKGGDLMDEDEEDLISDGDPEFNLEENVAYMECDEEAEIDDEEEANGEGENETGDSSDDDIREDIYGRTIDRKTGKIVGADPKAALKKLKDLGGEENESESKMQIDRALMGTINRLSEGTLIRSQQVVSEFWQNHSKNDVKSCLTQIMLRLIRSPYRLQDQLLSLYALFTAHIHAFISDEISAFFVESFLREFVEQISQPQNADDKKLENSVIFMAHLLNFHVLKMPVIVEVLQKLREKLSVDNLQLIVILASYSYKALRRHYWSAFSEELSAISKTFESAVFAGLPRAKFLGENLLALQKAAPTNIDSSITEHHLKLFHGLRKSQFSCLFF